MRDKLEKIIKAYEELEKKLSDPAVAFKNSSSCTLRCSCIKTRFPSAI